MNALLFHVKININFYHCIYLVDFSLWFIALYIFIIYCSDVVDMKRDCHGSCQHTSCQACSWVDPDPDCGACASDDFGCIKRFAKCIKRSYCTRSKFPCKSIAVSYYPKLAIIVNPQCRDI